MEAEADVMRVLAKVIGRLARLMGEGWLPLALLVVILLWMVHSV
jgi:hypothetical protein